MANGSEGGNGRKVRGKSAGVSNVSGEVRHRMNRNEHGMAARILMRHLDAVHCGADLTVDTDLMAELMTEAVNIRGCRFNGDEGRALLALARWLRDNDALNTADRRLLVRRAAANRHESIAEALQQRV